MPISGVMIIKGFVAATPVGEITTVMGKDLLGVRIRVKCTDAMSPREDDEEIDWCYTRFRDDVDLERFIRDYPVGTPCEFRGDIRGGDDRTIISGNEVTWNEREIDDERWVLIKDKEPSFNGDEIFFVQLRIRPGVYKIIWSRAYCDDNGNKLFTAQFGGPHPYDKVIAWMPDSISRHKIVSAKQVAKSRPAIEINSRTGKKVLNLKYYVKFGRGDYSDSVPFITEITNEEEARWNEAKEEGIPFDEYPPLKEMVERIYDEAQGMAESDFDDSSVYDDDTPENEHGFQDGWSVEVTGWPELD